MSTAYTGQVAPRVPTQPSTDAYYSGTAAHFVGRFITSPEEIAARLHRVKAFVFDWDGVFNGGWKDEQGASPFNEVDAMGSNLLRFNHYLRNTKQAVTAIITGENNKAAIAFAKREHFNAVYCGIKYKATALDHLAKAHGLLDGEVAFVFDDVLDFSIAARCGLRVMVGRAANPLMIDWALAQNYVDYLTANDGAHYAGRETMELLTGLSGAYEKRFESVLSLRSDTAIISTTATRRRPDSLLSKTT